MALSRKVEEMLRRMRDKRREAGANGLPRPAPTARAEKARVEGERPRPGGRIPEVAGETDGARRIAKKMRRLQGLLDGIGAIGGVKALSEVARRVGEKIVTLSEARPAKGQSGGGARRGTPPRGGNFTT